MSVEGPSSYFIHLLCRGMDKMNKVKPSKSQISQLSEKVELAEGPLAPKRNTPPLLSLSANLPVFVLPNLKFSSCQT